MGKAAWSTIRQSRFFYVMLYRRMLMLLWLSLVINIILSLAVYYLYYIKPKPQFYASNGVTQPIKLSTRSTPNYSSEALLSSEPPPDEPAEVTLQ